MTTGVGYLSDVQPKTLQQQFLRYFLVNWSCCRCHMHDGMPCCRQRWIQRNVSVLRAAGCNWALLLPRQLSVELDCSEWVLCETQLNAADHHQRQHRQCVSTVHGEPIVQQWNTEQIRLDRRARKPHTTEWSVAV